MEDQWTAPAGWYPNPNVPGQEIFWDGTQWQLAQIRPATIGEQPAFYGRAQIATAGSPLARALRFDPDKRQSPARQAAPLFLVGCAIVIGVSIVGIAQVRGGQGGIIWTGGYLLALRIWFLAGRKYSAGRAATGSRMTAAHAAISVAGVLVSIAVAVVFAKVASAGPPVALPGVGSCFDGTPGTTTNWVQCTSTSATSVAVQKVTDPNQCPETSASYILISTGGPYLCLQAK